MKFLIIGSMRKPEIVACQGEQTEAQKKEYQENQAAYEKNVKLFGDACRVLGQALVSKDHTIVVSVPNWEMISDCNTVANFIVAGASKQPMKEGKAHRVIFYVPQELPPPDKPAEAGHDSIPKTLQGLKSLSNIYLEEKFIVGKGQYKAKSIPNINDVDAVLLIGGSDGTASIGYAAHSMNKPCIAIPSLGGAAKSIYDDVLYDNYDRFIKQSDITEGDILALSAYWGDDENQNRANADKIVSAAEKIVAAYDRVTKKTRRVLWTIMCMSVGLLLFWVYLLSMVDALPVSRINVLFLFLFVSALLGTGLRFLTSYQENKIAKLTFLVIGIESVISMLVSFGLVLIYFVGGIVITGDNKILDGLEKKESKQDSTHQSSGVVAKKKTSPINDSTKTLVAGNSEKRDSVKDAQSQKPAKEDSADRAKKDEAIESGSKRTFIFINVSIIGFASGYLMLLTKLSKRLEKIMSD